MQTDLKIALLCGITALSSARELLGVFEDHGGHDGCHGEGYRATLDEMDEATKLLRAEKEKLDADPT